MHVTITYIWQYALMQIFLGKLQDSWPHNKMDGILSGETLSDQDYCCTIRYTFLHILQDEKGENTETLTHVFILYFFLSKNKQTYKAKLIKMACKWRY